MITNRIIKSQRLKKGLRELKKSPKRIKSFWGKYQLHTVATATILFFTLLVAAQFTQAQPEETIEEIPVRQVETLEVSNGSTEQTVPSQVKNLNSITLVAQTAGPVGYINKREGAFAYQGNLILSQSSNYSGGNSAGVGVEISKKSFDLAEETLSNTVEVVSKNREIADKNRDNTEELRKISDQSIGETETVLDLLNNQIENVESQIEATTDETTKLSLEAQLIPLKSSANQTQQALRSLRYQVDTDNPPTNLANLQKDLVYKSTELQLKSAEISRDIAALQYKQAQIAYGMTQVTAPIAGTIEKIYVEPGQYVSPGTPVAKISGNPRLCVVATISGNLATKIDTNQMVNFEIDGETYSQPINHVSSTPVQGNLYEVLISLPEWYANVLYENQTLDITLPLYGSAQTETQFIPVDAVFVTNTSRFVYVLDNGTVTRRIVETGQVTGSSIEIVSGLSADDTIILDRSVKENEVVERFN